MGKERVILCGTLIDAFRNLPVEWRNGVWVSESGREYPSMLVQEGNRYKVKRTAITKYYPLITMKSRYVADEARKKLLGFTQNENPDCNMVRPRNIRRKSRSIKEIYIVGL